MRSTMVVTLFALLATTAVARERDTKSTDPNRIICKSADLIGTRLQQKRTCLTAIQWEEMKRDQRNTVERVQAFKPQLGG